MPGAFERLAKSVLNRLGQDAFLLRGSVSTPCRAAVQHGVQIMGNADDGVFERDIAVFEKTVGARVGDTLQHPSGEYKLDGKVRDNGYTQSFTVQQVNGV